MSKRKLTTFGESIKQLRVDRKLPQRKIAAYLDIDASLLAKYERNVRQPSKELIEKIATLFGVDSKDLINEAFTDKIAYQILEEEFDSKLLRLAEEKVEYIKSKK
ncbi:helix-turn-helix domain-containing protein [Mucilaginibacter gilvus]|uniref:XRE family transcriptional regulator n=1 Tax=Mucilaginibacter gilvus TaxID=2305909 RepID=A0A444MJM9_9SPHI|nr:helix-turn-helix transcriptional regulator [Mucilaginibacter gilvus]RWY49079.1 XRE family transcriptional regulator [Mucilaginibacter gilvus]